MIGTDLPPDLAGFYRIANGMMNNHMDSCNVSFWSIERTLQENNIVQHQERLWIAFGDCLLDSWFFRISPEGDRTLVLVDSTKEVFASLPDLFEAYVNRPDSLGLLC